MENSKRDDVHSPGSERFRPNTTKNILFTTPDNNSGTLSYRNLQSTEFTTESKADTGKIPGKCSPHKKCMSLKHRYMNTQNGKVGLK